MGREFIDTCTYCGRYTAHRRTIVNTNQQRTVRSKRKNPTSRSTSRNNDILAARKLRYLINLNFSKDDYFLTLTFNDDNLPETLQDAQVLFKKYTQELRALHKKRDSIFKYIYTIEEKEKSGNKRVHCHIIMNRSENIHPDEIIKLWTYGFVKLKFIYYKFGTLDKLSDYMIKESQQTFRDKAYPWKRRYYSSRNLEQPYEYKTVISASAFSIIPYDNEQFYFDPSTYNLHEDAVGTPSLSFLMKAR